MENYFVMRAIVEKRIIDYKRNKEALELPSSEPSKPHFKVVVNNYGELKEEIEEEIAVDTDATLASRQVGLPSQPTSYLKYPKYDWL